MKIDALVPEPRESDGSDGIRAGMPLSPWEVNLREEVFSALPWLRVYRERVLLPDGREIEDFHSIWVPDCSVVYAVTDVGKVVVERQYKHGPRCVSLMLPAGAIEAGESPVMAAERELLEETGYAVERWDGLGGFSGNGNYGCGHAYLFLGHGAKRVKEPCSDDLEETEILEISHQELTGAVFSGDVRVLAVAAMICMADFRLRTDASKA